MATTKAELIDHYRHINVNFFDNHWAQDMEVQMKEEVEKKYGVEIDNIHYSGFYSQGDGASFEVSMPDINEDTCTTNEWFRDKPMVRKLVKAEGFLNLTMTRYEGNRYCHSHSVRHAEVEHEWLSDVLTNTNELVAAVLEAFDRQLTKELDDLEIAMTEAMRKEMDNYYNTLEEAYTYLTSDEQVWETIVNNELNKEIA